MRAEFGEAISQAYTITLKADRYNRLGELRDQAVARLSTKKPARPPAKSRTSSANWNTVPSARTSLTASRVSTAVTPAPCAR